MATHHFPVRAFARRASGLQSNQLNRPAPGLGYVPPFAADQNEEYRVSLGGCACKGGLSGNWYSYPEDQRQMYGMFDFLDPLNKHLFTIPVVGIDITIKRALLIGGGIAAAAWFMKR